MKRRSALDLSCTACEIARLSLLRSLPAGGGANLGGVVGSGASLRPANASHLAAATATAEELIVAIRFKPRHTYTSRHLEPFQDFSRVRINASHVALAA